MMTFKHLADLIGSRTHAACIAGIRNKYRAHRLYHGAPHRIDELERIGIALAAIAIAPQEKRG